MAKRQLQLPQSGGSSQSFLIPSLPKSELQKRLNEDDLAYLAEKQSQASTIAAVRQRAQDKIAKLKRKIESSPDFRELKELQSNVKAMLEVEHTLGVNISTILEKSMPDVEGNDLHSKFATLAKGGVR